MGRECFEALQGILAPLAKVDGTGVALPSLPLIHCIRTIGLAGY